MIERLPATMRAVLLTGFGGPDMLDLRDDVPIPRPKPGEVLVRITAAAVNNTDINTRIGWYSKSVDAPTDAGAHGFEKAGDDGWSGSAFSFPRIQGADGCGHIVAVGDDGDKGRIGQRVLIDPLIRRAEGRIDYLGSELDGCYAEFACIPARNAYAVQSALSDQELARFPCSYSTAENILTRIGLQSGERVMITGASGGVGVAAVQLAKRRGAEVVAICSGDKGDALRQIGADEVLIRGNDFGAMEPVQAVIDVVGGASFPALLDILEPGGRYGVSGAIAGPIVSLDLRTLYLKDLHLIGCTVMEPDIFPRLVGYIEQGQISPIVDQSFPLNQIVAAQEQFARKHHIGKIVLTI